MGTIPNLNLTETRNESGQSSLAPGAYVCRVVRSRYDAEYNRLLLDLDIDEGPHKGYYADLENRYNFWGLTWKLYLNPEDKWKVLNAVDIFRACNADFEYNDDGENDDQAMVGKQIGIITRQREYVGNDGITKKALAVYKPINIEDVRAGNFTIPDPVKAKGASAPPATGQVVDTTVEDPVEGFKDTTDDDCPF